MRIFWGVVGFIASVFFIFILFHTPQTVHDNIEQDKPRLDPATRDAILSADIPEIAKEAIIGPETPKISPTVGIADTEHILEDDERLRVFDEL